MTLATAVQKLTIASAKTWIGSHRLHETRRLVDDINTYAQVYKDGAGQWARRGPDVDLVLRPLAYLFDRGMARGRALYDQGRAPRRAGFPRVWRRRPRQVTPLVGLGYSHRCGSSGSPFVVRTRLSSPRS
jgi:hypothetical protein